MSLAEIYAEEAKDFAQLVEKATKNAKKILSKYPHGFDDAVLSVAVRSILIRNHIDAYEEVTNAKWAELLNDKTLFNAILAYYFSVLDEHLFRQTNWLKSNDVPTEQNDINLRQAFLDQLYAIRENKFEGQTVDEAIRFKLKQVNALSDVITKTDMECLKDHHTLDIVDVISSLLKLFCMGISRRLYHDPIISNKCEMGNAYGTLWSGKSLNNVHMEHLKAKVEQLAQVHTIVSESLAIQQDELIEKVGGPNF